MVDVYLTLCDQIGPAVTELSVVNSNGHLWPINARCRRRRAFMCNCCDFMRTLAYLIGQLRRNVRSLPHKELLAISNMPVDASSIFGNILMLKIPIVDWLSLCKCFLLSFCASCSTLFLTAENKLWRATGEKVGRVWCIQIRRASPVWWKHVGSILWDDNAHAACNQTTFFWNGM